MKTTISTKIPYPQINVYCMRKIKNLLFPLVLLVALLPVLSSCDDDEYYSPLIGVWAINSQADVYHEFEFLANGTGWYYEYNGWGYDDYPSYEAPFRWYENYNVETGYDMVQLRFSNGDVWNYDYEARGNKLRLWNIDVYDPYPMDYIFVGYY